VYFGQLYALQVLPEGAGVAVCVGVGKGVAVALGALVGVLLVGSGVAVLLSVGAGELVAVMGVGVALAGVAVAGAGVAGFALLWLSAPPPPQAAKISEIRARISVFFNLRTRFFK